MKVLSVRNVHDALPIALRYLREEGIRRDSRNGPVIMSPVPVATVYERPWERVMFWPERDAPPAFFLYEALWMLCGRNDVAGPARYAKQMLEYSDDGETLHGAYGYRWRYHFGYYGIDQIAIVIKRLRANKNDRRCVVQMWDPVADLGHDGKDVPCNVSITFQIDVAGKLQMVVFNRSNDVIWGALGANYVHMGVLQEYVARNVGVEMGTYTQVSVNFHVYDPPLAGSDLWALADRAPLPGGMRASANPYDEGIVPTPVSGDMDVIRSLVDHADRGELPPAKLPGNQVIAAILHAHHLWKTLEGKDRYTAPLRLIDDVTRDLGARYDWAVAMHEWIKRRYGRWLTKSLMQTGGGR